MTKEEMANAYAENIIFSVQDAVKTAYIKGYDDGRKSVQKDKTQTIDNIDYVDLGLPSGNLWGVYRDVKSYFTFWDANALGLPTRDDFKELIQLCRIDLRSNPMRIDGINGNSLSFRWVIHKVWYEQDDSITREKCAVNMLGFNLVESTFSGEKLPVLLVKRTK